MTFDDFSIDPRCLRILKAQELVEPTPIQAQAIPVVLEGGDVLGIAQTGTGKTLAFVLPSLTRIAKGPKKGIAMLVLTPTRELAVQVNSVIEPFAKALGLRSVCIYGGAGMVPQEQALRQGRAIVVATPGRLLDHIGRGNIRFDRLSVLVLDEADRMLDMGFMPQIRRILSLLPRDRQTLFFSATFPDEVARLASSMQNAPERISIGAVTAPIDTVQQKLYTVDPAGKISLLAKLLEAPEMRSSLVFIRTKRRTDHVARALHKRGFRVQAIHGDRSQNQRQQALDGFRQGQYDVLVATDVAARGIDVQGISHVINFDIPKCAEDYIHRIGRTGRANMQGDAITFVSPQECAELGALETSLGKNLEREEWEGAVPVLTLFRPMEDRGKTVSRSKQRRRPSLLRRR
ncbi:MAG TPA: DEAD/DEAH box helicase [Candidatus Hydrogenedentes bacterium]|nr:DEAD/DEAH box helicase [Candidatus Hydrogenedentota bacterium]HOS02331.1 DEAD/DEAH box helicase [Candidatus Hydrogenedentota bacterium]